MSDPIPEPVEAPEVAARLRLKRIFLRTLVISLALCALTAVGALLYGEFSETTGRILTTLGALAITSGIAMILAHLLDRQQWTWLNKLGLLLFALNFVFYMFCLWLPGLDWEHVARATGTSATLAAAFLLAIPGAALLDSRHRKPLAYVSLGMCALGFLVILPAIWVDGDSDLYMRFMFIVCILAFTLAQTCLLARVPATARIGWLLWGTLAAAWGLAAIIIGIIIADDSNDFVMRIAGALGVLDASGSLGLLIMLRLRRVEQVERLETTARQIELRCPRCTKLQVLDVGAGQCAECGLKVRIEVDEPRCVKCEYLLWQLPERYCPECGTPF